MEATTARITNPARGAAGRAQMLANAAKRRADKARAELESQGYYVIDPVHAAQVRGLLNRLEATGNQL